MDNAFTSEIDRKLQSTPNQFIQVTLKGQKRAKMREKRQKTPISTHLEKCGFAQTPPKCGKNPHFLSFSVAKRL